MLAFVIFAVTFVAFLLVAVLYLYPASRKKPTTIPGPDPSDPKDGNLPDIQLAGGIHNYLAELHDEYGPIASFWHGPQLVVSVASPEGFADQSHAFDRPAILLEHFKPLLGEDCILFSNGAEGRKRRNHYTQAFSEQLCMSYAVVFSKLARELCERWARMPSGQLLPLHQYMVAFAAKALLTTTFGSHFLTDDNSILQLVQEYDVCMAELLSRELMEPVTQKNDPREKRFQQSIQAMKDAIRKVLADAKARGEGSGDKNTPLVKSIISSGISEEAMVSDAIAYFIGGFHTTGNFLTWVLYYLALYPEVQEELYQELKLVFGTSNEFTEDHLRSLRYTRQVLDEALRCGAVAPFAARVQQIETTIGGHIVPSGTPVVHALGVILQGENTLWPNPERFDPSRFKEESVKSRPPLSFCPFGFAGKRKCPGETFSYVEGAVVVSNVILRFHLGLAEGQEATPCLGMISRPEDEVWLTLKQRE
ncbi:cytochrome P450 20A1-like [Hetaerina americana]|uniref:cytochrome P450 20A1-like n=1 Tax=Hetaerina americana TaxID=62018 RepID=UPI003A7F1AB7